MVRHRQAGVPLRHPAPAALGRQRGAGAEAVSPDDTAIPPGNALHARLPGAYFQHCARIALPFDPGTALQAYRGVAAATPRWFDALMQLRNCALQPFGLKDLGRISAVTGTEAARPGGRLGIFTLESLRPDELVLGDSDRHLRVVLSFQLQRHEGATQLLVATVVHLHHGLGRWYMLPVAPLHRRVVPLMLRRYARSP
ncbi:DUF2867 domain-containing protein, partial [Xanthomonas sp. Kuri4-3]